ncbi:DET1- and DDB1-associated protein 1, partial [Psidium guajava]
MSCISSNRKPSLSQIATNDGHAENSPYFDGWKAYDSDPFDPTENPNGVIQMGLAEHQLCFDLVREWLVKNPGASICTEEGVDKFRSIAIFQDYHGLPEFDRDLCWRTGVRLLPVVCHSSNNFMVTRKALEDAYAKAVGANIRVKGLLITNPSNPLGTILDRDTLRELMTFINEKNIHLVCDEIYAATVFRQPNFVSISEIIEENQEYNRDLVHIIYSLSKDMGLPGFRVGIVYSYNDAVVECGRKMSSFGLVSSQTQYLIASILSDDQFIGNFLLESSGRLATRHKLFTHGLRQAGIECLNSNAGLFLWMDLRGLLRESTVEAETDLWQIIINDVKLNVSPGSSFHCSEPGWFRVCIANMNEETMEVALTRIRAFVLRNGDKLDRKE